MRQYRSLSLTQLTRLSRAEDKFDRDLFLNGACSTT